MKTYTTSECIAILEREPEARFEAPTVDRFPRQRVARDGLRLRFRYFTTEDGQWWADRCPELRSNWVRTDNEES